MAKKKHQPPAKIKYDKSHPTVSIRVDQELEKKLDEIKEISGKSVGDILREAVGTQKRSTGQARTLGFTQGRLTYGVEYKCAICGGTIWIDTTKEKKAAAQYMHEHGWAHDQCRQKSG